jgi:glycosyltransferase involved in cell wall biosynthesis
VIVVIDGEDPDTQKALSAFCDSRLRIIDLADNVGGAEARNVGVRAARGEWVAFLDDDDEWMAHKLSRQIIAARWSRAAWPVISSRMIVRASTYELIRPLRSHKRGKPVSEFLFCRRSLKDGPFAMQTSTLMMRRELMQAVPFRSGLERHQDWDWLLRAERVPGVEFAVINEPLVVYRTEDERASVGRGEHLDISMAWGTEMRGFFSAKAYSWFLASECASRAVKSGAGFKAYAEIVRRFVFDGRPCTGSVVMMAVFLGLPHRWRRNVHSLARKWRRTEHKFSSLRQNDVMNNFGLES